MQHHTAIAPTFKEPERTGAAAVLSNGPTDFRKRFVDKKANECYVLNKRLIKTNV